MTATELATVARERDEIYRRLPSQVQHLWQRAWGASINIIASPVSLTPAGVQANALCIRHAMEDLLDALAFADWQDPE